MPIESLDPSKIGAIAFLIAVLVALIKGTLVPGFIYQRSVTENEKKDATIERLLATIEQLTRRKARE